MAKQQRQSKEETMDFNPSSKVKKRNIKKSMLLCCKLYISESRNHAALESIEQASRRDPETIIVKKFEDRDYNRVRYTLVSYVVNDTTGRNPIYSPLHQTVLAMITAAYNTINLELHCGTHPRLGVVDHISFHPLASTSLDQTAQIAKKLAADVGTSLQVPTYLYGAAHKGGRTLDSILRDLGYFKPNSSGNQWAGGTISGFLPVKPDEGPAQAVQSKGVVTIGATGWVNTYNIPVFSTDIYVVRRIAKQVSERGGGFPTVQAMALSHGDNVTEVACNLLEPSRVGGDQVHLAVERLAREEGVATGEGYYTDFSQEKIIETYLKLASHV